MGARYRDEFREALWELIDGSDPKAGEVSTLRIKDWLTERGVEQFYFDIVRQGVQTPADFKKFKTTKEVEAFVGTLQIGWLHARDLVVAVTEHMRGQEAEAAAPAAAVPEQEPEQGPEQEDEPEDEPEQEPEPGPEPESEPESESEPEPEDKLEPEPEPEPELEPEPEQVLKLFLSGASAFYWDLNLAPKTKSGAGALKDDMTGQDHIGYVDYALRMAHLIFYGLQTPCVFGLYAAWGTGKSFIMNKVIAAVKCIYLEHLLERSKLGKEQKIHAKDQVRCTMDKDGIDGLENLYRWARLGCPADVQRILWDPVGGQQSRTSAKEKEDEKQLDAAWNDRGFVARPLFWLSPFAWILFKCKCKQRCCGGAPTDPLVFAVPENPTLYECIAVAVHDAKDTSTGNSDGEQRQIDFDYTFVWW